MRNLPTYTDAVQAEALAFARQKIAGFARGTNPWSADPAMSADGSEAMFRHMVQQALQFTPTRMHIIEAAKAGDADAIEVLKAVLLDAKSKRCVDDLPTELIDYDMHVTAQSERRHQRSGPKKKSYILRDICIAMTVAALVDRYGHHGITATGTSPRRPRSFCAIVAEALRLEAGLIVEYDAVKAIWKRYGHNMPTVSGWAST